MRLAKELGLHPAPDGEEEVGGADLHDESEKERCDMEPDEDGDQSLVRLSYIREEDAVHTMSQAERQGNSSTGERPHLLRVINA